MQTYFLLKGERRYGQKNINRIYNLHGLVGSMLHSLGMGNDVSMTTYQEMVNDAIYMLQGARDNLRDVADVYQEMGADIDKFCENIEREIERLKGIIDAL